MTKEELTIIRKDISLREDEIKDEIIKLSNEQHQLHVKLRDYYAQYINEHFPYKVGDHLKYTFVNRDGDRVTREIEITEISSYRCRLSEIILYYKWKSGEEGIYNVNIDGKIKEGISETLEKI